MRSMIPSTDSYSILTAGHASCIDPIDQNDLAGEVIFKAIITKLFYVGHT